SKRGRADPAVASTDKEGALEQPGSRNRKPAFRYNARIDVLLLKEVTGVEPFNAGHGKTGEAWERVATNIHDSEEQRVEKKAKKSKEEERRETNGAAIREAAVKLMSDKNKTPKKTENGLGDEENDPPSSSTCAPSAAKTAASLASTLKEMSEAFHESNAKDSNDAVANRELKERELNLQDRKLALEEAWLELERKRQEQQDKLMNALLTKILEK
ncbi:hypothetical protein HDU99_000477, partial [Rhizoclosmatium hyalinum]